MITTDQILPLTETVAPADEAEVAEVVRNACRAGTPVYPVGGGTGPDFGLRPSVPGVGLSLRRLNRVIDHAAEDMTITVEAGLTVAELAEHLAARRQWLPVEIPQADRATLGGAVASNPSGPRRYAHGTIRDYVIGIRAVDGQGMAFSGGGRVVKNAAGYNLCRLMVGSRGTLGVITRVTLMVRPLPERSAVVVCDLPDFDTAERLLAGLVTTPTLPVAIELLTGPATQENPAMGPMLETSVAQLLVGFEGTEAEVDWMVGRLGDEWREAGIPSPVTIPAARAAVLWDWLAGLSTDVQISVPPSATVGLIEHLRQLDPNGSIQAHAGDGVIRIQLSPRVPSEFTELFSNGLRPAVTAAGGAMVVLSCRDGAELTRHDVWGSPGEGAAVMRAIKDRFDPGGLLNPGRFVY